MFSASVLTGPVGFSVTSMWSGSCFAKPQPWPPLRLLQLGFASPRGPDHASHPSSTKIYPTGPPFFRSSGYLPSSASSRSQTPIFLTRQLSNRSASDLTLPRIATPGRELAARGSYPYNPGGTYPRPKLACDTYHTGCSEPRLFLRCATATPRLVSG